MTLRAAPLRGLFKMLAHFIERRVLTRPLGRINKKPGARMPIELRSVIVGRD